MRPPPAPRPLPPRLLTAFGAVLLLAGTVEIHPEAADHGPAGEELVYTCAGDAGGAVHVEAARAVERGHCPGCLHRLQGGAADAPAPATLADRVVARPQPAAGDPALLPPHARPRRARAPPVLFS
jgi:hypothetical protein